MAAALLVVLGTASAAAIGCGQSQPAPLAWMQTCLASPPYKGQPSPDAGPVPPMTPSQDPQIMEMQCSPTSCGGVAWGVNYILPAPAAAEGWIVQEVTRTYVPGGGAVGAGGGGGSGAVGAGGAAAGAGGAAGVGGAATGAGGAGGSCPGGTNNYHYWEAWWVQANATTTGGIYGLADDTYSELGHASNTADKVIVTGKAKFYTGTLSDDFTPCNMNTLAYNVRSTVNQPSWWDGTGTEHDLTIYWDCIGNNVTWNLTTVPATAICTPPAGAHP